MSLAVRVVALVAIGGLVAFSVIMALGSGEGIDPATLVLGPAFYTVAAFLVLRVPENRVSWLLLWSGLGFGLGAFQFVDSDLAVALGFAGNFVVLLPAIGVLLPVWFPTGRPPTPAWSWVAWAGLASAGLFAFSIALGFFLGVFNDDIDGCYDASACLELVSLVTMLVASLAAVISLVVRWARSSGVERQQLKLMAAVFVLFATATAFEFGGGQGLPLVEAGFTIAILLIPAAIAVTISAYRLYDIDRIISRTVAYAIVVAFLGAIFAGVVVWVPNLLPGFGDSPLLVAVGTLAVAALFNPLRGRIKRWVDRRFNRSRYDAGRVMDEFVGSLRDQVESDEVIEGWMGVVEQTMRPSSVGVWVRS